MNRNENGSNTQECLARFLIAEIVQSARHFYRLKGFWPKRIEVSKDEYRQLQAARPFLADPDWHIQICGAHVCQYD